MSTIAEVEQKVAAACAKYRFRRRNSDSGLARQAGREVELLVDGRWVPFSRPALFDDPEAWAPLDAGALGSHKVRYLLDDLDAPPIGWSPSVGRRLRRSALGRRLSPPLEGGAARLPDPGHARRARQIFFEEFADSKGAELVALKEQAQSGYDLQQARAAAIEGRANFFLGAAGLTTTLVLANASVLLGVGDGTLHSPWRELSAIALAIASLFAILAGVRAMQAIMITFRRASPDFVPGVFERRDIRGKNKPTRAYLAALLVAQEREMVITAWKIGRLDAARRWFGLAVVGVVVVTGFVLVEVLS